MAAEHFEVDTGFLRRSTSDMRQSHQALTASNRALRGKLSELDGMWDGPAKTAFHQQFEGDCEAFDELCRQIDEILTSLEEAASEYETCEGKVKGLVDAIKV